MIITTVYNETTDSCSISENLFPIEVTDIICDITVFLFDFSSYFVEVNWDIVENDNGYFYVTCEGYNKELIQDYYDLVLEENPCFNDILIIC